MPSSSILDPRVQHLSDETLALFYARALESMVREQLRPTLSRAQASAKVPLYKAAMRMQMGQRVDDHQEKALAQAWQRSSAMRWEGLLHATNEAARAPFWKEAATMLTEVRNHVHLAKQGPSSVNVQPLLNLLDAWHNVPILMMQGGPQRIDPTRIRDDGRTVYALNRLADETMAHESRVLRAAADAAAPASADDRPTRTRRSI